MPVQHGDLPLHIAIEQKLDVQVVAAILQAHPASVRMKFQVSLKSLLSFFSLLNTKICIGHGAYMHDIRQRFV